MEVNQVSCYQWRSQWGVQGENTPLDSKKIAKNQEKERKNQEISEKIRKKMKNQEEKAKIGKALSLCSHLTDRANYATGCYATSHEE